MHCDTRILVGQHDMKGKRTDFACSREEDCAEAASFPVPGPRRARWRRQSRAGAESEPTAGDETHLQSTNLKVCPSPETSKQERDCGRRERLRVY